MKNQLKHYPFLFFFVVGLIVLSVTASTANVEDWMAKQAEISRYRLLQNVSTGGAARGSVVASPSKSNPDYFYHWVRDAGLVMNVVVSLYHSARTRQEKAYYNQTLLDFVRFSRANQLTKTPSGLGEPKFHADGRAFTGPWGRPQNDGPALRAISMVRLASVWLSEGREKEVREILYDGRQNTQTVLKLDLEYVSHHWSESSFDPWEEIRGLNFYTLLVQRRALVEGARLAYHLGDGGAGNWYLKNARAIEGVMGRFWDNGKRVLVPTIDRDGGLDYKHSGLDVAVILASLHADGGDRYFSPTDSRLQSTFHQIEVAFQHLYPVNSKNYPAVAIGRYPEDRYDGNGFGGGNAWVLATVGFGEFLHRAANEYQRLGRLEVNYLNAGFFKVLGVKSTGTFSRGDRIFEEILNRLRARGDAFIARVGFHGNSDGSFSEQMDRNSGYMRGASNLTWSHASFLTAIWNRARRR